MNGNEEGLVKITRQDVVNTAKGYFIDSIREIERERKFFTNLKDTPEKEPTLNLLQTKRRKYNHRLNLLIEGETNVEQIYPQSN